jgi:hypothetical protein
MKPVIWAYGGNSEALKKGLCRLSAARLPRARLARSFPTIGLAFFTEAGSPNFDQKTSADVLVYAPQSLFGRENIQRDVDCTMAPRRASTAFLSSAINSSEIP